MCGSVCLGLYKGMVTVIAARRCICVGVCVSGLVKARGHCDCCEVMHACACACSKFCVLIHEAHGHGDCCNAMRARTPCSDHKIPEFWSASLMAITLFGRSESARSLFLVGHNPSGQGYGGCSCLFAQNQLSQCNHP